MHQQSNIFEPKA